jgi:putative salt-induced outer membrane protein
LVEGDRFYMDAQIGPGVRRTHNTEDDETRTGLIGRGLFDVKYSLTPNTDLVNTLLVESGSYNTFGQNDFGVSVSMNEHLALKAGWQARYNSDVAEDKRKTDTLTTMNVVYKFK